MNGYQNSDEWQKPRTTPFQTTLVMEIGDISAEISLDDGFLYPERLTDFPHMHVDWEVQLPIRGSYQIELHDSDERIVICPGQLVLIPPGCYHSTFCEMQKTGMQPVVEKFTFRFRLSRSNSDAEPLFRPVMQALYPNQKPRLMTSPDSAILKDIWNEIMHQRIGSTVMVQADLQRFFLQFLRLLLENDSSQSHGDIRRRDIGSGTLSNQSRVMQIMNEQYHTPLTEQSIAEMLGVSVRSVSRLFSDTFGMTFKQKLTEVRMYHAKKYLIRTDITVDQIANRIGYESLSAFYTAFGKTFGMPPAQYRKMQKTERYLPENGQNTVKSGELNY